MQFDQIYPSNYVKASDLKGREITVVIAEAKIEKLGDNRKLVLYFQGKQKGLVTNKTNATRIAYSYGNDTDDWVGKEIVLYPDLVDFQGRTVEAIRVKPPMRQASPSFTQSKPGYELSTGPGASGDVSAAQYDAHALNDGTPF